MTVLSGVCVAMSTAFDDSGEELDEGRLRNHIDSLVDAEVHGLVLSAGTGEFAYLSEAEKARITAIGVEQVAGRIPVIVQTSAITTKDTIENSRVAIDMGADALMVLPPYFEGPAEPGVMYHYEQLAAAVNIPIVLYNIPVHSGFDITPAIYRELISMDNIDYIKDSTGDLIRIQQLIGMGGRVPRRGRSTRAVGSDGGRGRMDLGRGECHATRVRIAMGPPSGSQIRRGAGAVGCDASSQPLFLGQQIRSGVQQCCESRNEHGRADRGAVSPSRPAHGERGSWCAAARGLETAGERSRVGVT